MNSFWHRYLGKTAALVVLGAALYLGGEYISYNHQPASAASTPIAAPAVAPDTKVQVPGFTAVAKAVTPAVVNITSKAVRTRDSRAPSNRMPEEFSNTFAVGYAQAFSFMFSARPGTPAATMDGQVPNEVMEERLQRLQAALQHGAALRSIRPAWANAAPCW